MARAVNKGWDFVEQGKTYQYKEDYFIAMVTIKEDRSDEKYYRFLLVVEESNMEPPQNGEFEISYSKEHHGVYSGMLQLYKTPEYSVNYKWKKPQEK